jgi:DNA polymerase IV
MVSGFRIIKVDVYSLPFQDKEEYFRRLYALDDGSDGEEDTNGVREVLRHAVIPTSSPFPSSSEVVQEGRSQQPRTQTKVPKFHRTTSAPVSIVSVVRETPPLRRKSSLLRYDISTPEINDYRLQKATPPEGDIAKAKPEPARSASTPNIGSVVMKNSTGVKQMLRKRKRTDSTIKLVPENDRIFAGQTFFYIPADDVAPVRRVRITKARNFGAVWTKEVGMVISLDLPFMILNKIGSWDADADFMQWIPTITHVVVDKGLTYSDVLKFLKPILKADALPSNVILVNEDYPIDCTQYVTLLDPNQRQYVVDGYGEEVEEHASGAASSKPGRSLEIKTPKPKKWDDPPEKQTPPRSQSQSQRKLRNNKAESSTGVWLLPTETEEIGLVQSPQETTSPPNALHSSGNSIGFTDSSRQNSFSESGDPLDEMIEAAKKLEHLPLDDDDEEGDRPSSSEADHPDDSGDSDMERSPIRASKAKRKYTKKGSNNQENFSCMKGGTGIAVESNPNGVTMSILEEMADYYKRIRDQWRPIAYRKAIGSLKKQTKKITSAEEALGLPFIGHRIAAKIEEIALTSRLRRLDNVKLEPSDLILQQFLKVYGAGPSQAAKWMQAGHRSLEDLKLRVDLSENQRIGLEHYDDFDTRIPREQVTALGEVVKKAVAAIDPGVEAIIGGSYRRGAATSGDIDFIITKPGTLSSHELLPFLSELVSQLTNDGFLVAALAEPRSGSGSKWHGACVLPGNPIWRRIDFLVVPEAELGAALIYFTGDDIFNRSMRLLSSRKGLRLNQRGLYKDVMRGPGRMKLSEGMLVEGADEKRIFEILQVPYRPPEQRICH